MNVRRIKKALGLIIVDIAIIIGIFILQFRTDFNIIEKLGNLQITLARAEDSEDNQLDGEKQSLQNILMLSYNGINVSIDDKNPAIIQKIDSESKEPISLVAYKKNELGYDFYFSNDIQMEVLLEDETLTSPLQINVNLPSDVSSFDLPYSISQNMITQKVEKKSIVLDGKKNSWELKLPEAKDNYISFHQHEEKVSYAIYDNKKQFTFDNIHELAISDEFVFQQTVSDFAKNLVTSFENTINETSYTEQAIVSYVAAMASTGRYQEAIEKVPSSFKKSSVRTYLSAPYFNTLESMDNNLEETIKSNIEQIRKNRNSTTLDLYTIDNIAMNLWLYPDVGTVRNILKKATESDIGNASIAQVTGILEVYTTLSEFKSGYAKYLEPILENCIQKIMISCAFEGEKLTISENGAFLSVSDAVETGIALLRYGMLSENNTLKMAGRALVNSYISDSSSFDLRTLTSIYPILAYDNKNYPHFEKIFTDNGTTTWAWTCANNITFKSDTSSSSIITIDFPETWTHYVIIKGIPKFEKIFIYDIQFRTDPRFETYNSSGYVYRTNSQTLLLKSRHKTEKENIRLVYTDPSAKKVEQTPAAVESPANATTEAGATEATSTEPTTPEQNTEVQQATQPVENLTPANENLKQ